MKIIKTAVILAVIFFSISALYPHGINHENSTYNTPVLRFTYDDGEVMNFCHYKIFKPDAKTEFQSGLTDRNGRLALVPDEPGDWTVTVSDTGGHAASIHLIIDESLKGAEGKSGGSLSFVQKAIMAACVIWGAAGTALYYKSRG